jgi:hypothetical protein
VALDPQDPFAILARDANAALGHVPKDQYAGRFADQLSVGWVERLEVLQIPISARVNLCLSVGKGGRTCEKT